MYTDDPNIKFSLSLSPLSITVFLFYIFYLGNTKGTTNSSKSNDDNEKNAKKSNDDTVEPGEGTSLGEIPKIEKYIFNTRIDGLQTVYQVLCKEKWNGMKINHLEFLSMKI